MSSSLRSLSGVAALVLITLAAGCDDTHADRGAEPTAPPTFRSVADNGWELNSAEFNGWELNGWELNGWELNGWELNGWELNGWELNGVTLTGSSFTGTRIVDGEEVPMSGLDFIGAEIILANTEQMATLRIDNIHPDPAHPGGDVYFHDISVFDPDSETWSSLCRDGQGAATSAIPLPGAWNMATGARVDAPGAVTLACRGAALAKCVEWGYSPWASATTCKGGDCSQISLADHHQACTRMVRADYCGDGTPHTLNGTPIDVVDRLAPQIQAESTNGRGTWGIEAEWGPDGARCVGESLRLHMFEDLGVEYEAPTCLASLATQDCGSMSPGRGAQLFNKFCTAWTSDLTLCGTVNP